MPGTAQADGGTYYLVQIKPPTDVLFEGTLAFTLFASDALASVTPTKAIYGGLARSGDLSITAANDFETSGVPAIWSWWPKILRQLLFDSHQGTAAADSVFGLRSRPICLRATQRSAAQPA